MASTSLSPKSPISSVSLDTRRISHILRSTVSDTPARPRSTQETFWGEMPTNSANRSWVRPAASRALRI